MGPSERFAQASLLALVLALAGCGSSQSRFESHMERGRQYLATGNLEKASVEFRNALQIDPRSGAAYYLIGRVAERLGNINEAVDSYAAAIDVAPSDDRARASLAKAFVLGGATQRALEVISPGLLDHPDNPDLLAARARPRDTNSGTTVRPRRMPSARRGSHPRTRTPSRSSRLLRYARMTPRARSLSWTTP